MSSIARDSRGRWLPGVVLNPDGRPVVAREVRDLARSHGPEAIAKLAHLMRSSKDERVQLAAAEELLNRGYGRPMQQLHIEHEDNASPFASMTFEEKRALLEQLRSLQAKTIEGHAESPPEIASDDH
jgi:hypothetical protein